MRSKRLGFTKIVCGPYTATISRDPATSVYRWIIEMRKGADVFCWGEESSMAAARRSAESVLKSMAPPERFFFMPLAA